MDDICSTKKLSNKNDNYISIGERVLYEEAQSLYKLSKSLNKNFYLACSFIKNCKGKVIISGVGKSGIVGKKIAATMSSLGIPAVSLHSVDACHGDLGIVSDKDIVILISYSGMTKEVLDILPAFFKRNILIIAMTGSMDSILAKQANIVLDINVNKEACHLNLAPTNSTVATMALGDALAVAVSMYNNYTKESFAAVHPQGTLGQSLLLRAKDIMIDFIRTPTATANDTLQHSLIEITAKSLGCLVIIDDCRNIEGVVTDGDLRRVLQNRNSIDDIKLHEIMTKQFICIDQNELVVSLINLIKAKKNKYVTSC